MRLFLQSSLVISAEQVLSPQAHPRSQAATPATSTTSLQFFARQRLPSHAQKSQTTSSNFFSFAPLNFASRNPPREGTPSRLSCSFSTYCAWPHLAIFLRTQRTDRPARFHHTCLPHSDLHVQITTMAEAAQQQVPTFKLVLVGDGGTGKVSSSIP